MRGQSDQADALIFDLREELQLLMRTDAILRELTGGDRESGLMRRDVSALPSPPLSHIKGLKGGMKSTPHSLPVHTLLMCHSAHTLTESNCTILPGTFSTLFFVMQCVRCTNK